MSARAPQTPSTLGDMGEDGFLRYLARRLPERSRWLERGIGDDCAVLVSGDVMTTDLLVEGTHFTAETIGSPRRLGRKAVTVNASDVAAMGAAPTVLTIAMAAPTDTPMAFIRELYRGIRESAERVGCEIAGGDTTRGEKLTLAIAMLGTLGDDATARPALRDGAREGQTVYVTGWPGESAAGLALLIGELALTAKNLGATARARLLDRHQNPTARVAFGQFIRRAASDAGLAMIDVSDGLSRDAARIAAASDVGIEIEQASLPVSKALRDLERATDAAPASFTLHGGEDYELLFTTGLSPSRLADEMREAAIDLPVHAIGRVTRRKGLRVIDAQGRARPLRFEGFEHFDKD